MHVIKICEHCFTYIHAELGSVTVQCIKFKPVNLRYTLCPPKVYQYVPYLSYFIDCLFYFGLHSPYIDSMLIYGLPHIHFKFYFQRQCWEKTFLAFLPISVSTRKCRKTPPNICYHHACVTEGWYATIEWQIQVSVAINVPGYCIALLLVVGGACSVCKWTTQTMEYCLVMSRCELTPYRNDTMILRYVLRIQLYIVFTRNSYILFIHDYAYLLKYLFDIHKIIASIKTHLYSIRCYLQKQQQNKSHFMFMYIFLIFEQWVYP